MIAVSGSASANPILSVNPSTTTVNVGDTFTVDIDIANVVDLFSYNFDLVFDPTYLLFSGIVQGTFFPPPPPGEDSSFFPGLEDLALGRVEFVADSVVGNNPGVSGDGTLAIATFEARMAGTPSITLANLLFLDATFDLENPILFSAINAASVQVDGVATVPEEPSTMILVVAALALAAYRSITQAS